MSRRSNNFTLGSEVETKHQSRLILNGLIHWAVQCKESDLRVVRLNTGIRYLHGPGHQHVLCMTTSGAEAQ